MFDRGVFEAGVDPGFGDRGVCVFGLAEQAYSDGVVGQARGSDDHSQDQAGRIGDDASLTADDLLAVMTVPS
jgi:hypothetical protein